MSKAHSGFVNGSGVQAHSAGDHYPATIVVVGGIPRDDNSFNHYQVWHGGEKYGPFWHHYVAECFASDLVKQGPEKIAKHWGHDECLTDERQRIKIWSKP